MVAKEVADEGGGGHGEVEVGGLHGGVGRVEEAGQLVLHQADDGHGGLDGLVLADAEQGERQLEAEFEDRQPFFRGLERRCI